MNRNKRWAGPCGLRLADQSHLEEFALLDATDDLETACACTVWPSSHAFGAPEVINIRGEVFRSPSFNEVFRRLVGVEDANLV